MPNQADDIEGLLERALAQPPPRRAWFLDQECSDDPAKRDRIERLLHLTESSEGFLERSPLRAESEVRTSVPLYAAGQLLGAYRLLRRIGTGGTSEVWLAERTEGGFQQRAAVKIVRDAQGGLKDRFAMEREILASLAHRGIARLYDGGLQSDGCAYMIMEYVEGEHLDAYARTRSLPLQERLALFLQVCDAVAYAHTRLVVHRDIKPGNILVNADGEVKLVDFGIAKLVDAETTRDVTGALHMSPAYAAPEQLLGGYISTATDVYALGVTLFELMTGRRPWNDDGAVLATAVKRLMDTSVPPPSRMAPTDMPIPTRALRGDLDAIVARAMRKEPDARYPDARALADDIRRCLAHQPVQARAGARAYIVRRFFRRNWLGVTTATAVFAAMTVALAAVVWQAKKAQLEAQRASAVQSFMVNLFRVNSSKQADPVKARQTTARELLDTGMKEIESGLDEAPENKLALLRVFAELSYELALGPEEQRLRRQAVALSRDLYGATSSEVVENLIDLSSALLGTGSFDDAKPVLDELQSILDRKGDATSVLRGRALLISAEYFQSSDVQRAYADAQKAVAVFNAIAGSHEYLGEALYMAGLMASSSGKPVEATDSLRRAIDLSRANGTPDPKLSILYYQLAESESAALQHAAAEASARQSLALALSTNGENHVDTLRARMMLGRVLLEGDRIKESLPFISQARERALGLLGADDPFHTRSALAVSGRAQARAGELDAGLADLQAALAILRRHQISNLATAIALEDTASALVELGRRSEAFQALDEARSIRDRVGQPAGELSTLLRARAALDDGRPGDARSVLSEIIVAGNNPAAAEVWMIKRDLLEADAELQSGAAETALKLASRVGDDARTSELALNLRSVISDSEFLEGLARLRSGDANTAHAILAHALATRVDLYLSKSPKIAEAKLALAECELALGHRSEAASLVTAADAIEAQHSSLSSRYVVPLQRLRAELGSGRRAR